MPAQSLANDLLVCTATELECALLRPHVPVLVTGVGAVNMAHVLTKHLEHNRPAAIIVCGIGGAYADTGFSVGDVVCAESECYADLGADSPDGFLDMQQLGFPIIASPPIYNVFPMQLFPAPRRAKFATVNTSTGRDETAFAIHVRTGAAVENMEGAAAAHVAALYGIPIGEIRGISNRAGLRDRGSWRIKEAAEAAQIALIDWLQNR